jgi:hypothetical protein
MPARSSSSFGRPVWSTIQVSSATPPPDVASTRSARHCCGKSTIDAVVMFQ